MNIIFFYQYLLYRRSPVYMTLSKEVTIIQLLKFAVIALHENLYFEIFCRVVI